jgi:hypothetical protein
LGGVTLEAVIGAEQRAKLHAAIEQVVLHS